MNNAQITKLFEEMAELLELAGENPFRIRAYQRAAQAISGLSKNAIEISQDELLKIPGVGKGILAHIKEIGRSGKLIDLEKLRKKFPEGLLEILRIQGLGPKRTKLLFEKRDNCHH